MDGQMHGAALGYVQRISATAKPPSLEPSDTEKVQHRGSLVVQIWSSRGQLLATSYPIPALALSAQAGFHTVQIDGARWRIYVAPAAPFRLQLAQSANFRQRVILHSAWKPVASIVMLIPLSGLLLWLVIHLTLRPVERLVQSIASQDERTLAQLSVTQVPQELVPLVESMNGLIARLRGAFDAQRHFVQDAAHELRTPLAACTLQAGVLRQNLGDGEFEALDRLQGGLHRMRRLVEQLLRLAHEDAERLDGEEASIDLRALIRDAVADLMPLAEQRGIDLGITSLAAGEVRADARGLRAILDNLIDNAVRYTAPGGRVDIASQEEQGQLIIDISDTGPGIPPEALPRVFDRFYRLPDSGSEGSGIGLAIARAAARRSHMEITLINRDEPHGLIARISIPRP
jgi:two-component system OmpR family sensor kinase/two-component system sensor histidine kinase QseC